VIVATRPPEMTNESLRRLSFVTTMIGPAAIKDAF
jgi:hypothetical protein